MEYNDMKIDDVIKRINELYAKMKAEGLTDEEKEEQAKLRRRYIDSVKANTASQLSGIKPNNPKSKN